MLVIVGHGPSVLDKPRGPLIDASEVVRLKDCLRPDPVFWGTRTDHQFVNKRHWRVSGAPTWAFAIGDLLPDARNADQKRWMAYYATFRPKWWKPSSGLRAILCAVEFLDAKEIGLIGFDAFMDPSKPSHKFFGPVSRSPVVGGKEHDYAAERRCAESLTKLVQL